MDKEKYKELYRISNKLFNCLILLGPSMYFGYKGKTTEMGLAIVAGSIALAFLNLDKLKKFKGAGFEAEMRDVIEEANDTLAELQKIASAVTEASLYTLTESQFYGNFSFDKRLEIHDKLVEKLSSIKVSDKQIEKINMIWNKGICLGYHNEIREIAISKVESSQEKNQINDKFKLLVNFERLEIAKSKDHKKVINELGIEDETIAILLYEFEAFQNTNNFRKEGKLFELELSKH